MDIFGGGSLFCLLKTIKFSWNYWKTLTVLLSYWKSGFPFHFTDLVKLGVNYLISWNFYFSSTIRSIKIGAYNIKKIDVCKCRIISGTLFIASWFVGWEFANIRNSNIYMITAFGFPCGPLVVRREHSLLNRLGAMQWRESMPASGPFS